VLDILALVDMMQDLLYMSRKVAINLLILYFLLIELRLEDCF
jgi:hypothetical protein